MTFGVAGSPAPTAGTGGVTKTGEGTLIFGQVHGYTGATVIEEGLARVDGSVAASAFTVEERRHARRLRHHRRGQCPERRRALAGCERRYPDHRRET